MAYLCGTYLRSPMVRSVLVLLLSVKYTGWHRATQLPMATALNFLSVVLAFLPVFVDATSKCYIIYMGKSPQGDTGLTDTHHEKLASVLGPQAASASLIYSYKYLFNGFSAVIPTHRLNEVRRLPGVVTVIEDELHELDTTRTWQLLGLRNPDNSVSNGPLSNANGGKDAIIGMFDTGIWPESKSFDDSFYGPPPARWQGSCMESTNFKCNKKIIGAKYFLKALMAANLTVELRSPLDTDGHGTHTASIAAGSFVENANYHGLARGTASGAAYRAFLAIYKACSGLLCFNADILAAMDEGVKDGCDVFSVSLGARRPLPFNEDPIALGAFHASMRGISVVTAAGNAGPFPSSVVNGAPWTITVGATTIDRALASYVVLGDRSTYQGESLVNLELELGFYAIVSAADIPAPNISSELSALCLDGSLDIEMVRGKIVCCERGLISGSDKGQVIKQAKGIGLVIYNNELSGETIIAEDNVLPATSVGAQDGKLILAYINSTKEPLAYISKPITSMSTKPAPQVAYFSARGPSLISKEILKPDIAAPGVNILAAYSEFKGSDSYFVLSGTSMACPHVTGVVALLRTLHPDWSPAAIQSAIITTGKTLDYTGSLIRDSYNGEAATPLEYGGGQIDPQGAADPGLVYDSTPADYLQFFCNHTSDVNATNTICSEAVENFELNYPSISVRLKPGGATRVTRKVKSVIPQEATFQGRVELSDTAVSASVTPSTLKFIAKGEEKIFMVEFCATEAVVSEAIYGSLTWNDGFQLNVRSPIVIMVE